MCKSIHFCHSYHLSFRSSLGVKDNITMINSSLALFTRKVLNLAWFNPMKTRFRSAEWLSKDLLDQEWETSEHSEIYPHYWKSQGKESEKSKSFHTRLEKRNHLRLFSPRSKIFFFLSWFIPVFTFRNQMSELWISTLLQDIGLQWLKFVFVDFDDPTNAYSFLLLIILTGSRIHKSVTFLNNLD